MLITLIRVVGSVGLFLYGMKMLSDGKSLNEIAKIMKLPVRVCKSADMAKGTEDMSVEAYCCRIREKGYQLPKPGDHYEP